MSNEWLPDESDWQNGSDLKKSTYMYLYAEAFEAKKKLADTKKAIAAAFDEYERERKSYDAKKFCKQTDELEKNEAAHYLVRARERLLELLKVDESQENPPLNPNL